LVEIDEDFPEQVKDCTLFLEESGLSLKGKYHGCENIYNQIWIRNE
jgi:hypothetical protein